MIALSSSATMADVFRSFLDSRPLCFTRCNLQVFMPSKRRSFVLDYPCNSRIGRIKRRPLNLTLLCVPFSSMPSSPELDVISTHEHSDGSLIFRFGDPSEVAKSSQVEESMIEQRDTESGSEVKGCMGGVLVDDHEREVSNSSLDEVNGESNSMVNGRQIIGIVEKETDLSDSDVFELPIIVSDVGTKDSSTQDINIEIIGNMEVGMNKEHEDLCQTSVSLFNENLKTENNIATLESPENSIVEVTTLESISQNPDSVITVYENDVFQASIETVKTTEMNVSSDHLSVEAEMPNDIVEDGTELGTSELMPLLPKLEQDLSFPKEAEDLKFQAGIQTVVTECSSDINDIMDMASRDEVAAQLSIGAEAEAEAEADVNMTELPNEIVEDVIKGETVETTEMSVLSEYQSVEAEMPNDIVEDGTEVGMSELMSLLTKLEPDLSLPKEAEDQKFEAGMQTVISKSSSDINYIMEAPQAEVAAQLPIKAQAQASVNGTVLPNEIVGDGIKGDVIQLIPVSSQLEVGMIIDEKSSDRDVEDYMNADRAETLMMVDNMLQNAPPESESTEDNNNEKTGLVESSGNDVAELEPAESTLNSQEIQKTDFVLSSSAALLPHPSKVLTGGEDAYFVTGKKWLGVADGVGQWSFEGTNPGVYAQELIKICEKLVSVCKGDSIKHPSELLSLGVAETQSPGSSTVLIAQLVGQLLE